MSTMGPLPPEFADGPLKKHQHKRAAAFIAEQPPRGRAQWDYDKGWSNAVIFEKAADKTPTDELGRADQADELRKLGYKIVPPNRQAAAPSRREIHRAALRYLRRCRGLKNFNIADFVKYLKKEPNTRRLYRKSGANCSLSDHAVRAILKDRLGIVMKPGRKKNRA